MIKQIKRLLSSTTCHAYLLVLLSINLFSLYTSTALAREVNLAWNASLGATGYRVYYGLAKGNYTYNIDVGNTTTCTVASLQNNKIYFFAVQAYGNAGKRSRFSNEVNDSSIKNDFNGDGKADLVWQHRTTGQRSIWFMNGATRTGSVSLGITDVNWNIVGAGDFNGDRKADLVWQHRTTGQRVIWFMNGATRTGSVSLGITDVNWNIVGAGDFNGDGKADLVWQHRTTGQRSIWFMNGATRTGSVSLGITDVNWNIVLH